MFRRIPGLSIRAYRVNPSGPCQGYRLPKPQLPYQPTASELKNQIANANLFRLVSAYRAHGHKKASIDPLGVLAKLLNRAPAFSPLEGALQSSIWNTSACRRAATKRFRQKVTSFVLDVADSLKAFFTPATQRSRKRPSPPLSTISRKHTAEALVLSLNMLLVS
jgi:hypothetical protein